MNALWTRRNSRRRKGRKTPSPHPSPANLKPAEEPSGSELGGKTPPNPPYSNGSDVDSTRDDTLVVKCPRCDAEPGELCTGMRGPRARSHAERHQLCELERAMRRHPAASEPGGQIVTIDGQVAYPLDDRARIIGLEAIAQIREEKGWK